MTHRPRLLTIAAVIAVVIAGSALLAQERNRTSREVAPRPQNYVHSTVLAIRYGAAPDEVGQTTGRTDEMPIGPEGFAIDGDNVVVLDTVNEHVKYFNREGTVVRDVKVGRGTDLVASGPEEFLVADPTSHEIVKITSSSVERIPVSQPIESFGARTPTVGNARIESTTVSSDETAPPAYDTRLTDDHNGVIVSTKTGKSLPLHTDAQLGSINLLGVDDGGNIYVVVEELLPAQTLDVRRTVRKFSSDGALQAVITIPIDNSTFPARDLLVDGAGTIYHMQPRAEHLLVEKWEAQ